MTGMQAHIFLFNSNRIIRYITLTLILLPIISLAQISPGDLSQAHSYLEGMSNCTQCHTLGQKISNDKCLVCHTALKARIDKKKGYHSSKDIAGKKCITCHSDHNGIKFKMIRFDKDNFDHSLTGFELTDAHKKLECKKCHDKKFIKSDEVKKKKGNTFLGLKTDCLACHADYHQKTLPSDCIKCHDLKSFKKAPKFNHDQAKFKLVGKHLNVDCIKCHHKTNLNGKEFQIFAPLKYQLCTDCHKDVHNNAFGQNCTKCHSEISFTVIKNMSNFDHNSTKFKLENKHKNVDCKKCHKTKLTDPIKHDNCTDCHADYHKGQFDNMSKSPDCSSCHTTRGFKELLYNIERHNKTDFPLVGAHLATPCFVCHKKEKDWNFNISGKHCTDCHDDIHKSFIDSKYYPEENCKKCHTEDTWKNIDFDHSTTKYELLGEHKKQSCRACHFKTNAAGQTTQHFGDLTSSCTQCHVDKHHNQFEKNGVTDCSKCHSFNNWKAGKFNHNNTRFPLDGKHEKLLCSKCHKNKVVGNTSYVNYKLNTLKCEDCH